MTALVLDSLPLTVRRAVTAFILSAAFISAGIGRVQASVVIRAGSGDVAGAFYTLEDAYAQSSTGDTIEAEAADFNEDPVFGNDVSILLKGGYDALFGSNSGMTTVSGTITIVRGGLTVERLIISRPEWYRPTPRTSWELQFAEALNTTYNVTMYDLDLFDTDAVTVTALKTLGHKVICYMSAGSYEDWRPDAADFPPSVLGRDYPGWPGERFIDIRSAKWPEKPFAAIPKWSREPHRKSFCDTHYKCDLNISTADL